MAKRTLSDNPAARRAREQRAARKAAKTTQPANTPTQPNTGPAAATAAAVKASQAEGRKALGKLRSLEERQAEAQRKGYVGQDASDLGDAATRPPIASGVDGPGGHPQDPTSRKSVGAAARGR